VFLLQTSFLLLSFNLVFNLLSSRLIWTGSFRRENRPWQPSVACASASTKRPARPISWKCKSLYSSVLTIARSASRSSRSWRSLRLHVCWLEEDHEW